MRKNSRPSKSNDRPNRFKDKTELKNEAIDEFGKIQEVKKLKTVFNKASFQSLPVQLTDKQNELYKTIRNSTFTIVQGPAGTSKTYTACYAALGLLADGKVEKIIITKPIVEAGESLGYLPGSLEDKVGPYMKSYINTFEKIIGKFLTETLIHNKIIEVNLLAYMRGDTFDNSIMILDESQNTIMSQLMLWSTRLGNNSKAVMLGDVSQYDVKKRDAKFLNFIELCDGMSGVSSFKFEREDIVRNKFLIELTDRYEKWKYSTNDGENESTSTRRK